MRDAMGTVMGTVWGRMAAGGALAVMILGLGLGFGTAASADEQDGDDGVLCGCGDRGRGSSMVASRLERLAGELNLTEEQQGYLDEAIQAIGERRQQRRSERGTCTREILASLEDGDLDPASIHEDIDARMAERQALAHEVADDLIAFVNSLDADQRAALAERMEDVAGRGCCGCGRDAAGGGCHRGGHGRHGR